MTNFRALILIALLISTPSWAKHLPKDLEPGSSVNDIDLPLTEQTAAELAQVETGGKILSVDSLQNKGHVIFRVKVLHQNGKVKIYRFDSETGHALH